MQDYFFDIKRETVDCSDIYAADFAGNLVCSSCGVPVGLGHYFTCSYFSTTTALSTYDSAGSINLGSQTNKSVE